MLKQCATLLRDVLSRHWLSGEHCSIRKSKDDVYGIWVYKVLGIWEGHYRVKKITVSCMKPWTEARSNRYMKYHSKLTYQLSFWNVSRKVDCHAGGMLSMTVETHQSTVHVCSRCHFLQPEWHAERWWGPWQCYCHYMMRGLRKLYETLTHPHHQKPIA